MLNGGAVSLSRSIWPPDEGMPNRPSIFAYLVFGPGGITVEGTARPIKTAAGRGPGATLGVQARIQRVQVDSPSTRVYSKPILCVLYLMDNPETQPSHIKGWEGGPGTLDTFPLPHAGALDTLELSNFG
jgi:hypothetical protein